MRYGTCKLFHVADCVLILLNQAEDTGDSLTFLFESANQERHSDFELKLMDIDSEQCVPLSDLCTITSIYCIGHR